MPLLLPMQAVSSRLYYDNDDHFFNLLNIVEVRDYIESHFFIVSSIAR